MSGNIRRLHETLDIHLNEHEQSVFIGALNEYHAYRDVVVLVKTLNTILDTSPKRQLLSLIRKVIPRSDMEVFDQCARGSKIYGNILHPVSKGIVLNPAYTPDVIIHSSDMRTGRTSRSSKMAYSQNEDSNKGERVYYNYRDFRRRSNDDNQKLESCSLRESSVYGDNKNIQDIIVHRRDGNIQSTRECSVNLEPLKTNKVKRICIEQQANPHGGFGFSIRGGSEYGLGIYVSSADENGPADRQGLRQGDLILEVNDISFEKITHDEGAKIVRSARKLDLIVCRIGRIPGSYIVHQMYKWVDANNRPVSPPPELEQIAIAGGKINAVRRRSGLMLLKECDERKVNVVVHDIDSLGLRIRGGREFGLGIYISGVDPNSAAENSGIKVGDQILDINGESFIDISHAAAVKVLKVSKHMMMTIKDIGKLPYARTTIDTTEWLLTDKLLKSRSSSHYSGSANGIENNGIGFTKGAGSQLMLHSLSRIKWGMIEEQAHQLLNEKEQETLRYYLSEYQKGFIRVDGLVMALFELFNTCAKFTLMSEIRNLVSPREMDRFDALVLRKEVDNLWSYTNCYTEDTDVYESSRLGSQRHRQRKLTKSEDNKVIDETPVEDCDESDEIENRDYRLNPHVIKITGTSPVNSPHHRLSPEVSAICDTVDPKPGKSYLVDGRSSPKPIYHVPGDDSKHHRSLSNSRTFDSGFQEFASGLNDTQSSPRPSHRSMRPASHWKAASHDRYSTPSYDKSQRNTYSLQNNLHNQKSAAFTSHEYDRTQKNTVAEEEIRHTRQILSTQNSLSTRDESSVDVNGINNNGDQRLFHQRSQSVDFVSRPKKVTISSKDPVNIDDALAGRFNKFKRTFSMDKRKDRHQRKFSSSYGNINHINAARKKYGAIPLEIVHIKKKKTTLGMAIEGGSNTRQPLPKIINLQPGGAAAESGNLKAGHVILEVNGISLCGLQHAVAAKMIAEAFKNKSVDKMELLVTESTVDFEAL